MADAAEPEKALELIASDRKKLETFVTIIDHLKVQGDLREVIERVIVHLKNREQEIREFVTRFEIPHGPEDGEDGTELSFSTGAWAYRGEVILDFYDPKESSETPKARFPFVPRQARQLAEGLKIAARDAEAQMPKLPDV